MKEKLKLYQGYFIIAILSLICIFFLPLIGGSSLGLGFLFPTTTAGWLIWSVSKIAIIIINLLIFSQFIRQARVNIKDNANYIAAQKVFNELKTEEQEKILPPRQFFGKLYRSKGTSLVLSSALSLVAFSNAILTFDWITMLTYLFTIVTALIFGWITMLNVEDYWTEDYYKLAQIKIKEDAEKAEKAQPQLEEKNVNNS